MRTFKILILLHALLGTVVSSSAQDKEVNATIMRKYSELRAWKYAYSNGASIVVRPDDSAALVHIRAFSPGGALLFPAADYAAAIHAGGMIGAGMSAKLKGTHIVFKSEISPQFSLLHVSCPQEELETALRVIRECFTRPEKNGQVYGIYLADLKKVAKLRGDDPKLVLFDGLERISGYPDGRSFSAVSNINAEHAYEIFRKAFGSAGNFSFIFTGKLKESSSMNTSKLLPLISSYIGALPSHRDITVLIKSKPNDDHFLAEGTEVLVKNTPELPVGKILRTWYSGTQQEAMVCQVYHGNYRYSDSVDLQLKVLAGLLKEKLKSSSLLKMSSLKVYVETAKYPKENYRLVISYTCLPSVAESGITWVQQLVSGFAQTVDQEELKHFVDAEKLLLKRQYFDNDFWTVYFEQEMMKNEDPYDIAHYPFFFRKATPANLKKAGVELLNGKNYIQLLVLPAKLNHK